MLMFRRAEFEDYSPTVVGKSFHARQSMRLISILAAATALAACSREDEVTGSTNTCAAQLYRSYDPKNFDQCVNACIKCDNGVMTTCSTSCRLKGAR